MFALVLLPSATTGAQSSDRGTCGSNLGTLSAASVSLSESGTIDADPDCVSSLRDPADAESVYYARRHTFTLDAAATVSTWVSSSQVNTYMLLVEGSGGDGSGVVLARSGVSNWVLGAGTYTLEVTTIAAEDTGAYTVGASWARADECLRDLGVLSGGPVGVGVGHRREGSRLHIPFAGWRQRRRSLRETAQVHPRDRIDGDCAGRT
ncbi:hypothetical protein [Candidatus Poriferisodalis sp.]|uniref:hypothetical protein n=1 Tax=Candidatus Poriferisodalis sp. TaxID=3101277 RepID=UPI003B01CC29